MATIHVPPCPPGLAATPIASMKFESEQVVRVSGLLRQASYAATKMHCDDGCCNESQATLGVFADASRTHAVWCS